MICNNCQNTFSSKWSLKTHQKNAKYCLKNVLPLFICEYCNINLSSKQRLTSHIKTCGNNNLKNIIIEKNETIKKQSNLIIELQAQLSIYKEQAISSTACVHEIAKQPKIQNKIQNIQNNKLTVITPFNLDDKKTSEFVQEAIVDKWDQNYFYGGQKGMARFAFNNLLKDENGDLKYICTDPSRHVFKYKTTSGDVCKDVKAKKLSELIGKHVIDKSSGFIGDMVTKYPDLFEEISENYKEIREINDDNTNFRVELSSLTSA